MKKHITEEICRLAYWQIWINICVGIWLELQGTRTMHAIGKAVAA